MASLVAIPSRRPAAYQHVRSQRRPNPADDSGMTFDSVQVVIPVTSVADFSRVITVVKYVIFYKLSKLGLFLKTFIKLLHFTCIRGK